MQLLASNMKKLGSMRTEQIASTMQLLASNMKELGSMRTRSPSLVKGYEEAELFLKLAWLG